MARLLAPLALLAALAACKGELPPGMSRLPLGTQVNGYVHQPEDGLIGFLSGLPPRKTKVCAHRIAEKDTICRAIPEYRPELALHLPGGHGALVIGTRAGSGYGRWSPADGRRDILHVSMDDGRVLRTIDMPSLSKIVGLVREPDGPGALVFVSEGGRTWARRFDPVSGALGAPAPAADVETESMPSFGGRTAFMYAPKAPGGPRIARFDMARGTVAGWEPAWEGMIAAFRTGGGLLAAFRVPGTVKPRVAHFPAEGGRTDLGEFDDVLSLGAAGGHALVALKGALAAVPLGGGAARRLGWTSRRTVFVGADAPGALYVAVDEPLSAWSLSGSADELEAQGAALERRKGEFFGVEDESWILIGLAVGIGLAAWLFVALRSSRSCSNC